jgi:CTP synthase
MTKFIFVTGGVISGIGKGVSAASLGNLLKARGFSVFAQKLDPYLNVDPGTMSPYQHGEVYVTSDGGETDLDLGHYERFIGSDVSKDSNYTSGKIYSEIIKMERQGIFEGKTVQVVPHVTNLIESKILQAAKSSKADFIIVEIGGTVGDIESEAYVHAIAEFAIKNPSDVAFIHVSYIPFLQTSKEFKTKPTQHSIGKLRSYGIKPNILLLRSHTQVSFEVKEKLAKVSLMPLENIIDVYDAKNIYSIPLYLEEQKVTDVLFKKLKIKNRPVDLSQ